MKETKVSDLVMQFLVNEGIKDLFLISGGGMMHLLDSAGRNEDLNLVFNLNEQASAMCAEAYAQYTGNMGACMVTSGPGATNAVTGCAGAWISSTPVIYISGQVKTSQMGQERGLRSYGLQEVAIVPCVQPITKYAVTIKDKNDILYHLQKAVFLAREGRRGPVWIDIPLDIQGDTVDEGDLKHFDPKEIIAGNDKKVSVEWIDNVYKSLNESKRPAFLLGYGVVASHSQRIIQKLADYFGVPMLATWRAKGIFGEEEELFFGSPGVPALRYSNYVLQNADFLLIIGTRLNPLITAYNEANFAPNAKKIIVDIDEDEIKKLDIEFDKEFVMDAGVFLQAMDANKGMYVKTDRAQWINYCKMIKRKYPLEREKQPFEMEGVVDGYKVARVLSDYSVVDDVFVGSSSGRTCGISHMAYSVKRGQHYVGELGLGSMGWTLPAAIGACVASGKHRTLLIEGDGSLQHNIQELQLITTYELPLKIFVYENSGYASIYTMQRNSFDGRYYGCDSRSGLSLPQIRDIANMYRVPYFFIESDQDIEVTIQKIMSNDKPCICEINGYIDFDEIPKSRTVTKKDGTMESSKLENLYPFVTEDEQRENMPQWEE